MEDRRSIPGMGRDYPRHGVHTKCEEPPRLLSSRKRGIISRD